MSPEQMVEDEVLAEEEVVEEEVVEEEEETTTRKRRILSDENVYVFPVTQEDRAKGDDVSNIISLKEELIEKLDREVDLSQYHTLHRIYKPYILNEQIIIYNGQD